VRYYIPKDDGREPTDFDVYYDVPAKTDKDLAARWYIKIERDPERIAHSTISRTRRSWNYCSGRTTTGRNRAPRATTFLHPGQSDLAAQGSCKA
jgi:hypothetical protein